MSESNVIPLPADRFRPMSFSLTADRARSARTDYLMASALMLRAQQLGQKALRGEITPPERCDLVEASIVLGIKPPQPS
jgi:hypothetical protein